MKREPVSKETIVVASQEQIAVYVTDGGYVAIRQDGIMCDDSLILIAPANVEAVIAALKNSIGGAIDARQDYLFGGDDEPA